ncbi:MAG: Ig-like domain-containing protein [Rhodanobacteraceae bacterium]|nr:Ig-like domain-containing protein [Rhodanobacteraceae bacterium]
MALDWQQLHADFIVAANVTDGTHRRQHGGRCAGPPTTRIDNAPTLTASTPSNGTPAISEVNETVAEAFSEPVDVTGGWFRSLRERQSQQPASPLVVDRLTTVSTRQATSFAGENCTLTFNTSAVTDEDGSADTLVDPGSIAFAGGRHRLHPVDHSDGWRQQLPSAGDIIGDIQRTGHADCRRLRPELQHQRRHFAKPCRQAAPKPPSTPARRAGGRWLLRSRLCAGHRRRHAEPAANTVGGQLPVAAVQPAPTMTQSTPAAGTTALHAAQHHQGQHRPHGYQYPILEIAEEDPERPGKILDVYRNCSYQAGQLGQLVAGTRHYRYLWNRFWTPVQPRAPWPKSLGFSNSKQLAHSDQPCCTADKDGTITGGTPTYGTCRKVEDGCSEDQRSPTMVKEAVPASIRATQGIPNAVFTGLAHKQRGDMARSVFVAIRYEGIASEDANDGDIPDLE